MLLTQEICYMFEKFVENRELAHMAHSSHLNTIDFMMQFGIFELRLPRQCGKTIFIKTYYKKYSDKAVCINRDVVRYEYLNQAVTLESMKHSFRQNIDIDFFRKFIFLDEVKVDDFLKVCDHHHFTGYFNYNTTIISLYT